MHKTKNSIYGFMSVVFALFALFMFFRTNYGDGDFGDVTMGILAGILAIYFKLQLESNKRP